MKRFEIRSEFVRDDFGDVVVKEKILFDDREEVGMAQIVPQDRVDAAVEPRKFLEFTLDYMRAKLLSFIDEGLLEKLK